jgi:hypothetical protein
MCLALTYNTFFSKQWDGFSVAQMAYLFTNQKSKFGLSVEGLVMEDVGIFYDHFVYFMAIWYNCGHLV